MEYNVAIKKEKIMPSEETWVDLQVIIASTVNQTELHTLSLICGI